MSLNWKKIIVYLAIIAVAVGLYYKNKQDANEQTAKFDKIGSFYAELSVAAELFRNEPERFYTARDSLFFKYNLTADSITAFKKLLAGREEKWQTVWLLAKNKTDSLVAYFKEHPVEHDTVDVGDTVLSLDTGTD